MPGELLTERVISESNPAAPRASHLVLLPPPEPRARRAAPAEPGGDPSEAYLRQVSESSRSGLGRDLDGIAAFLGYDDRHCCPWWELRSGQTGEIRAWLSGSVQPATANRRLSSLKGCLKACWRAGLMSAEELARAADWRPVRGSSLPAGRALAPEEVAALIRACRREGGAAGMRDEVLIRVLWTAGLRREEEVWLDLADWQRMAGELLVRHGKGRKERCLPVQDETAGALRDWLGHRGAAPGPLFVGRTRGGLADRRLTPQAVRFILRRRGEQSGVALSCHDLRRTFATALEAAGVSVRIIQLLLGHSNVNTTMRYLRPHADAMRGAVGMLRLPGLDG